MRDLYQSQRAMRNMRQAAMQRGVIAILDVGSSKIACLVLRFDGPEHVLRRAVIVSYPRLFQYHATCGADKKTWRTNTPGNRKWRGGDKNCR